MVKYQKNKILALTPLYLFHAQEMKTEDFHF